MPPDADGATAGQGGLASPRGAGTTSDMAMAGTDQCVARLSGRGTMWGPWMERYGHTQVDAEAL